jgi:hypothetical protein
MKAYERRGRGAYPYFKIARWDARICAFRPLKATAPSEARAIELAGGEEGTYRLERFDESGSMAMEPFEI